ncbi:MAG: GAF domain-containing protein, partial [Gammaproteobacteria bacterium]|nr:GAF domain-containing protein [Gammaproteobacteria bacterium]NIR95802.1 GAF domain-containing protein [Gammaproteobacteria bacterium]
ELPRIKISGDAMMEEIMESDQPVLIEDAQIDPRTNKDIVAALGNRTIINMSLKLMGEAVGVFGTGSFGDEGVKVPSATEMDFMIKMAGHTAAALERIRYFEDRRQAEAALQEAKEKAES